MLDDHPATIIGTVVNGDKPVAGAEILFVKSPSQPGAGAVSVSSSILITNANGQFRIGGLAPGEYRVAAFSIESLIQFSSSLDLSLLTSRGEKVTLERGGQQTIQLKPMDPAH